jgi:hypothetical protein
MRGLAIVVTVVTVVALGCGSSGGGAPSGGDAGSGGGGPSDGGSDGATPASDASTGDGGSCVLASGACDQCASAQCASQADACMADATCYDAIKAYAACICGSGTAPIDCYFQHLHTGDAATQAYGNCVNTYCAQECGL